MTAVRPFYSRKIRACVVGYVFGLEQPTLFANGPMSVSVVHEVAVMESFRGRGVGRALMVAFEEWARARSCGRVGLATRRAAAFHRALGYEQFSTYFRKLL